MRAARGSRGLQGALRAEPFGLIAQARAVTLVVRRTATIAAYRIRKN
jgi:hypothetical protein